uniref:Uncharacterized protein n=1 Tax=Hanusia phi TaxID=3032 RepID=A0A7S0DW27_9CRYP
MLATANDSEEQVLVETNSCSEGQFVKISKQFQTHWACKKDVGKVGRLSNKDEYAGWWVEFPGQGPSLFQTGEKEQKMFDLTTNSKPQIPFQGVHQLAFATEEDIRSYKEIENQLNSLLSDDTNVKSRNLHLAENDSELSPRTRELCNINKQYENLGRQRDRLAEQLTQAWAEAVTTNNKMTRLEKTLVEEIARSNRDRMVSIVLGLSAGIVLGFWLSRTRV